MRVARFYPRATRVSRSPRFRLCSPKIRKKNYACSAGYSELKKSYTSNYIGSQKRVHTSVMLTLGSLRRHRNKQGEVTALGFFAISEMAIKCQIES